MFFTFNDTRVNLLNAISTMADGDEIQLEYTQKISVGAVEKAEKGMWDSEHGVGSKNDTVFYVYPTHPKFSKLRAWIEANTL